MTKSFVPFSAKQTTGILFNHRNLVTVDSFYIKLFVHLYVKDRRCNGYNLHHLKQNYNINWVNFCVIRDLYVS